MTTLQWLSLHVRGAIYQLGRLQFQRGRSRLEGLAGNPLRRGEFALALHIPESGPLTPQRCDQSLQMARQFFPRHFPDEPYRIVTCDSWLLDPQLAEYLPSESNIIRFQRRFQLLPDAGEVTSPSCALSSTRAPPRWASFRSERLWSGPSSPICAPAGAGIPGPAGSRSKLK